jgi:Fanconi-associated nuclease 1
VPDLFLWRPEDNRAMFVEVKGPGDTLRENQKV